MQKYARTVVNGYIKAYYFLKWRLICLLTLKYLCNVPIPCPPRLSKPQQDYRIRIGDIMSVIKILTFENIFLDFLWRLLVALRCSFFTFVSADVHLSAVPSSVFVACGRLAVFMLFIPSGKNYLECQWFLMNELIEYIYKITNFFTDLNKKKFFS